MLGKTSYELGQEAGIQLGQEAAQTKNQKMVCATLLRLLEQRFGRVPIKGRKNIEKMSLEKLLALIDRVVLRKRGPKWV